MSDSVSLLVLSVVLTLAVIALGFVSFHHFQTKKSLQALRYEKETMMKTLHALKDENEKMRKNITESLSKIKQDTRLQPTSLKSTNPCVKCDKGWEQHGQTCYYFSTRLLTWNQSREECVGQGGDLVKIDSRNEQMFLEKRLREKMSEDKDKFWIGLTDSEKEGRWLWVDGSELDSSLKFWKGTEPDDWKGQKNENPDGEDCVRMGEKAGSRELKCWFDQSCNNPHRSICEKSAVTFYYD